MKFNFSALQPATRGGFLRKSTYSIYHLNVDLFKSRPSKSRDFLTKFSLKNLVVKFVVSNFAAYSMTYTFTGSLASDNPFGERRIFLSQKHYLDRRKTPRAAIISMPFFDLSLRIALWHTDKPITSGGEVHREPSRHF